MAYPPIDRVRKAIEARLGPDQHMPDAWDHDSPGHELLLYAAEQMDRADRLQAALDAFKTN